jgi:hypothetical protein
MGNEDMRLYTRRELEEVAGLGAGLGAGAVMRQAPDVVMPSEEISEGLGRVLADFDERRGSAAGYTAEQLSGTRRGDALARDTGQPGDEISHDHTQGLRGVGPVDPGGEYPVVS